MDRQTQRFGGLMSGVHGVDHLLKRLFPPLVPVWAAAFGFPLWKLGLLIGANSFGSAVGQAPMGVVSDRSDRRLLLSAGLALVGVSVAALGAIPLLDPAIPALTVAGSRFEGQFLLMLAVMVAAGLGSSVVHPAGYPLISANVPEGSRGVALGLWGSAAKFGDGLAPAMVGLLLVVLGWHEIVVAFGVLGVGYAVVLFVGLREFDTRPQEAPAGDCGGPEPLDRRRYLYPMLAVFAYFTVQISAANGVTVFLPQFVTSVYGYAFSILGYQLTPESTASFYYAALLLVAGGTQLITGHLVDVHDSRHVLIAYLVAGAAVLFILSAVALPPVGLFLVLAALGMTLWGLSPARDALIGDIAPAAREGRTFGYLWTGALLAAPSRPPSSATSATWPASRGRSPSSQA
ncbi:MFS transporter [Haloplanus sp. GCM10025708]|uniref:MFS transporter n=1 Tax=Haloplanus sp. GCM10025708 TaxID=3252679 RepID=UPI00361D95DC